MCGLFGIMGGGIQSSDLIILENLSYISAMRGTDSTGVAYGNSNVHQKDKAAKVFKVNGDPFYFQFMAKNAKDIDSVFNNFFIGHTRSATRGEMTPRAAHPYDFTGLVGAHNGTIKSYHHGFDGYPTDSARLYATIDEKGIQEALNELNDDDAFALVWYDKETKKVNFLRNSLRPLYFAISHDHRVMYWYSEAAMLRALLERHNVKHSGIFEFTEGVIFSFDPSKIGGKKINDCYTTDEVELPTKKAAQVVHIGNKQQRQQLQQERQQQSSSKKAATEAGESEIDGATLGDIPWISPEIRERLQK